MNRKIISTIAIIALLQSCAILSSFAFTFRDTSKLAKDNWYKLRIPKTGIYKLTYSDLRSMGLTHPEKAKIYGYGAKGLSMDFSNDYPDDLPQVPIWIEKGNDNSFGNNDYILFFAQGPISWNYNTIQKEYYQQHNPYSTAAYYFVSDNDKEPQLTVPQKKINKTVLEQTITTYDYYALYEKEFYNYLKSGIEFYGDLFISSTPKLFTFSIPNITNDDGKIAIEMAGKVDPSYPASYTVKVDNKELVSISMPTTSGGDHYTKAKTAGKTTLWKGEKNKTTAISITYNKTGTENARLNYIRINCKAKLALTNAYTFFREAKAINTTTTFQIETPTNEAIIWM